MTPTSSPNLERRLNLRDLVLFNLVAVLGISWVATAAKAGPSSITLWVLGAILFFVPQGRDERQVTFTLPFAARIHFLGTHLHPYGVSIELYNVSRQELVWKGARRGGANGAMEVYSNPEGYLVRAGEAYKITGVYDNPNTENIDAMAGLFMLYSRD